ncbi:hypothetical protein FA13DRAFT_1716752 [Coprinellus micaceus]|uniref:Uncharacterized protein n=1 Tax=Coprinellus micaceus TaxID=71717 RepID=A0A4Y7SIJ4_COPMI|nr:hypothetical protein FA13DRAFT_1716752 [Coprinellus micaceus]
MVQSKELQQFNWRQSPVHTHATGSTTIEWYRNATWVLSLCMPVRNGTGTMMGAACSKGRKGVRVPGVATELGNVLSGSGSEAGAFLGQMTGESTPKAEVGGGSAALVRAHVGGRQAMRTTLHTCMVGGRCWRRGEGSEACNEGLTHYKLEGGSVEHRQVMCSNAQHNRAMRYKTIGMGVAVVAAYTVSVYLGCLHPVDRGNSELLRPVEALNLHACCGDDDGLLSFESLGPGAGKTEVRHSGLDHREVGGIGKDTSSRVPRRGVPESRNRQTDRQDRGLRDWRNAQPTARGWGGQTCRDACNGDGDSPEARTSPLKPGIICAIAFLGASLAASASKASGVANMLKVGAPGAVGCAWSCAATTSASSWRCVRGGLARHLGSGAGGSAAAAAGLGAAAELVLAGVSVVHPAGASARPFCAGVDPVIEEECRGIERYKMKKSWFRYCGKSGKLIALFVALLDAATGKVRLPSVAVVRKLVMPMHAEGSGAANPTIREHSLAIEFVWYHEKA